MNKTLGDIISFIRSQLDEKTPSFWTDEEIKKYINQAKDDLFVEMSTVNIQWFVKSIALQKSFGTIEVELPCDFYRVNTLTCTTSEYQRIPFSYYSVNSRRFQDLCVTAPNEQFNYNPIVSFFPYDLKRTNEKKNIMYLAPKNMTIDFTMEYTVSDPDLIEEGDTFNMFANHLGYIQDKALMYCYRKGPSGQYEKYEAQAKNKLRDILTSLNMLETQSSRFVTGFGE